MTMQQLKRTKANAAVVNDYCGYVPEAGSAVEESSLEQLLGKANQEKFFKDFVLPRKPLKIVGGPVSGVALENFSSNSIVNYLGYDGKLQVERKYESGYGLGYEREKMSLEELFEKFRKGDLDYYLTTQYKENNFEHEHESDAREETASETETSEEEDEEADEEIKGEEISNENFSDSDLESIDFNNLKDDYIELDEEEIENRISELLQPPLTNLLSHHNTKPNSNLKSKFPLVPEVLSFLIPQQINLWIGANASKRNMLQGNDNVHPRYPELNREKSDFGLGRFVPQNGLSSGLHHDHSDNLYILFEGWKRFTLIAPSEATSLHTVGEIYRIYKTGIIDYNHPGWSHVSDDGSVIQSKSKGGEPEKPLGKHTPPSFSQIPPVFLHLDEVDDLEMREKLTSIAQEKFPEILRIPKMEVWLSPGDMLFLPAGWFHEVTSYGSNPRSMAKSESSDVHIALNYWFAPPNGETIDKPYQDTYWEEDFKDLLELINENER